MLHPDPSPIPSPTSSLILVVPSSLFFTSSEHHLVAQARASGIISYTFFLQNFSTNQLLGPMDSIS